MTELIKPKEIQIKDLDGVERTFIISRFPAVDGREILSKYPVANTPKVGDYGVSKDVMSLLMKYVAVQLDEMSEPLRLSTKALIDNHVPDSQTLMRIELEALRYNFDFFGLGGSQDFLGSLIQKYLPLTIRTVMDSLPPSLQQALQAEQNSNPQ